MKCKVINNTQDVPYIEDFIEALKNVSNKYICYSINGDYKYPERIFAYEFYHQYRKIMENKSDVYEGILLNGEQTKGNKECPIAETISKSAPDLVLHKSIGSVNDGGQYWLCEIKMNGNVKVFDDLTKLTEISNGRLKFQEHIFLYVGCTYENAKAWFAEKCDNYNGEIVCVFYYCSDDSQDVYCIRLKDIK